MLASTTQHHHGACGILSQDRQSGVIIRVRIQDDVCSGGLALRLLAIVSGGGPGGGHRPRGPAWRAHHRRGRRSAWHMVSPIACTTDTTEGLSRHRKERYGTLQ